MESLSEIYEKYRGDGSPGGQDGDKGTVHNYIEVYEEILKPYRELDGNFLEIGVSAGLSIKMWKKYFTKMNIYGIDINPNCYREEDERTKIFILDTSKPEQLEQIKNLKFDIIIDDGSHSPVDQVVTFNNFYPRLKENGLFVTEDCQGLGYMEQVMETVPHKKIVLHDLRNRKQRHDDILVSVWK